MQCRADASELDTNMEKSEGTETNTENSQIQPDSQESDSKFFAIRTTGGQEHIVVNIAQNRINSKKIPVRSILLLDSFKGYIIIESSKLQYCLRCSDWGKTCKRANSWRVTLQRH